MKTQFVMNRFYCYYRKICKVKGVVQTFHWICLIEFRIEQMFNTVALNEHQLMQQKLNILENRVSYPCDTTKTS